MSDLDIIVERAIVPAYEMLPSPMASAKATVMLLAIGLQESRLVHRRQIGGPARGLWQFELGGGCVGVLNHPLSRPLALEVCAERGVKPIARDVYGRIEHDDILAAVFARLLLWTDTKPLPDTDATQTAWAYYLRNWRPGKPHPNTWPGLHRKARGTVEGMS